MKSKLKVGGFTPQDNFMPGPGQYNPNLDAARQKGAGYSIGKQERDNFKDT